MEIGPPLVPFAEQASLCHSLTSDLAADLSSATDAEPLGRRAGGPCNTEVVQDRYAGDLGDFLKLGLLRWLAAPPVGEAPLALGVVWYLADDEAHNEDGKHIAYLEPGHRTATHLRSLDTDLYDRLARAFGSGRRSVEQLEASGVLPSGTCTHDGRLTFAGLRSSDRVGRLERRREWLRSALDRTGAADLVFLDPDNGVRPADHPVPRTRNKAEKHAYLDEVAAFAERGQSVVAYHHADRSAPVHEQARRRLAQMEKALPATPLAAVRASRGTTRLFLVTAADPHVERLTQRLHALETSQWSREFVVYWWPENDDPYKAAPATAGLRLIGYWRGPHESDTLPDPRDWVDPLWDLEQRDRVINHLRKGFPANYQMGYSECRICGCRNGSSELTDGHYLWPEGLVHYVEAHDVRLPHEFVHHVDEFMIPHSKVDLDWWASAEPSAPTIDPATSYVFFFDDDDRAWRAEVVGRTLIRLIDGTNEVRGSADEWAELQPGSIPPPPTGSVEDWLGRFVHHFEGPEDFETVWGWYRTIAP